MNDSIEFPRIFQDLLANTGKQWLAPAKRGMHIITYRSTSSIYGSISLLDFDNVFIFFRSKETSHPGRASLSLQGCLNVAVTKKNNNRFNQKKKKRRSKMNMALMLTSLPVMLRTTPGWVSLLLFLGLLIPAPSRNNNNLSRPTSSFERTATAR